MMTNSEVSDSREGRAEKPKLPVLYLDRETYSDLSVGTIAENYAEAAADEREAWARIDELEAAAAQWETVYGFDKYGVAAFLRARCVRP